MKLWIFISISLIFLSNSLYCQTSDIIVQAPIGSSVFLEDQYAGKITPDDSEVVIHNIDEGDHTITIAKEGFKTHFGSVRIKDHSVVRYKGPVDLLLESENEDNHVANYPLRAGTKLDDINIGKFVVTPYIWDHSSTTNNSDDWSGVKSGNYQRCTVIFLKCRSDPEQKTLFLVTGST